MFPVLFTLFLAGISFPLWFDGMLWEAIRVWCKTTWDDWSLSKLQSHNERRALLMPYVSWSDTVAHNRDHE